MNPPFLLKRGLVLGVAILLPFSWLRAGSVISLAGTPEVDGKLSLTPSGIHMDSSFSPGDIALGSVLAANFTDVPFALDSFSVNPGDSGLPLSWKTQEVGISGPPGGITCANGEITLTGSGADAKTTKTEENYFFAGQPWTGNGEWTIHVKQIDPGAPLTTTGIMLREGLEADSPMVNLAVAGQVKGRALFGPEILFRSTGAGGRHGGGGNQRPLPFQLPVWLRLTLNGLSVEGEYSTDGKIWAVAGQQVMKSWTGLWIGFAIDSRDPAVMGKAVFDQVTFTPGPSPAQVVPPGVLLTSGSFLAGTYGSSKSDDGTEGRGMLERDGKSVPISRASIAVVTLHPTDRSLIAPVATQVGLLMKNGDFMEGDPDGIGSNEVRMNSILLGIATYPGAEVRACVLHPLQAQPTAPYEIRLRDGSVIFASGLSVNKGQLGIGEVSGITIPVTPDEIAQFRAGPAVAQDLLALPWKATALPAANAPATATGTDVTASVPCWVGNNQEQMLVLPAGTSVDFPLSGTFHSVAVSFAVAPGAPNNAQAAIRILADGREIGRTPPFRVGDQPRLAQVTLMQPKTLTFVADTASPNTRVLVIDPVAVK